MKKYIDIRVSSTSDDDLKDFVELLSIITKLGNVGACRTLKVTVDGDGSGKFDFSILKDGKVTEEISSAKINVDEIEKETIWLGE